MPPLIQRVNVDFTGTMLEELDREAKGMNISRQAVIKTLLRRALDEQYVAAAARPVVKERERTAARGRPRRGRRLPAKAHRRERAVGSTPRRRSAGSRGPGCGQR